MVTMEPCTKKQLCFHLIVMLVSSVLLLSAAAVADGLFGVDHHLANSGSKGVDNKTCAMVTGWSPTTTIRTGPKGGHSGGHGHGHGNGNEHGLPKTPAVLNPRTVTGGGNHRHGRNAAAPTNHGRPCAVVACCLLMGMAILLRLL